jgi:hypothetical protein
MDKMDASQTEKDLEIYDVWESPNGNLFIKLSENYSIAIGPPGKHDPNSEWGELETSQYVRASNIVPAKKVGSLVLNHPGSTFSRAGFG